MTEHRNKPDPCHALVLSIFGLLWARLLTLAAALSRAAVQEVSINRFFGAAHKLHCEGRGMWTARLIALIFWGISSNKFTESKFANMFGKRIKV